MNYCGGTILDPYFGDVLYTRPEEDPVQPDEAAEVSDPLERDRIAIGTAGYPHYLEGMPPPTLTQYMAMREHPAIVFAYFLVVGPIFAGSRNLVIRTPAGEDAAPRKTMPGLPGVTVQDGPEDKFKRATVRVFEDQWPDILTACECLNYGHWTQEVTWDRRENLIAPVRFNSFRPWEIVLVPDKFNDFAGFKLGSEEVDARYAFHAICDEHRRPLLGHPRACDAYPSWYRLSRSHENGDRTERKASGIQMMIGVPPDLTMRDADGTIVTHTQAVQRIHNAAISGKTWTYPLFAFKLDTLKSNIDLAKLPGMKVDQFNWGDTAPAIVAGIERRRELMVEIVRAYHRPEREAMEGQFGTKAEAGVQGQIGTTDSELVHGDILTQFNEQTFNRYLVTNKGPNAAGSMYWKPVPLTDAERETKRKVLELLIGSPTEGPDMTRHFNKRQLAEQLEMPLLDPGEVPELPPMPTGAAGENGDGEDEDGGDPLARRNGNGQVSGKIQE